MDFARAQLKKFGWEDGKGLGKDASGISDPIKVKLKKDKTGIGHDVGKEYTNHWWDNVFNKTASSIQVTDTEDGVEIVKNSKHEKEIAKNLQTYSKKAMAYGNFVRKATLSNGFENEEKAVTDADSEEEMDVAPSKFCLVPENEDEIFSKCGGRTAHKGARHGLKLSGKLQRIQEQEQLMLEKMKSKESEQIVPNPDSNSDDNKERMKSKKKKKKKSKLSEDEVLDLNKVEMDYESVSENKKRKRDEDSSNKDEPVNQTENDVKSKKKKKSKHEKNEVPTTEKEDNDTQSVNRVEIAHNDNSDSVISKKKKKKKKEKHTSREEV